MKYTIIVTLIVAVLYAAVSLLFCAGPPEPSEPDPSGHWDGAISILGMDLAFMIDVEKAADGSWSATMDIPDQGAWDLPLQDFRTEGDSVWFDLPSNLGTARFSGIASDSLITGRYTQSGYEGTFELRPGEAVEVVPPPYTVEEVRIEGEDVSLAGTLTLPEGEPPFPGVVLYTGSGSQDRNESVMGFRVFGVLADSLTRKGIAVLRCDDRGFAGSWGGLDHVTDSVFAYDASLMLDYMLSRPEIDPGRVGLLGHSEGSTVAFMVAAARPDDVAFVVSMAGPSVSGYEVLLSQIETLGIESGLSEEEIRDNLDAQREIMDLVVEGGDASELEEVFRASVLEGLDRLSDEELASLGDVDAFVEESVRQAVESVNSDWFRNFVTHDPADEISGTTCPVLAVYGSLDIQVPPSVNLEPMEEALSGNPDCQVVLFDGANHLFQAAVTGSVEEYASLPGEFTGGFTDAVADWILSR
jgi:hypothetical protein